MALILSPGLVLVITHLYAADGTGIGPDMILHPRESYTHEIWPFLNRFVTIGLSIRLPGAGNLLDQISMVTAQQKSGRSANQSLALQPGQVIGERYVVQSFLGAGWEGEVYEVRERGTGVRRAAKFYLPRPGRQQALAVHARKLERLRGCEMVLQYHHTQAVHIGSRKVWAFISDLVEGEPLDEWLLGLRNGRLELFEAFSLLHELAKGLAPVHELREYHGDLHAGNILVRRVGIHFDLKLLDFFHQGPTRSRFLQDDVVDLVRVFHQCLGGWEAYSQLPKQAKAICRGLRRTLILRHFPTAGHLRSHLESFCWENCPTPGKALG
jgi:protein kinase-like protein